MAYGHLTEIGGLIDRDRWLIDRDRWFIDRGKWFIDRENGLLIEIVAY